MNLPYLHIFDARQGQKVYRVAYYRRGAVRRRLLNAEGKPVDPNDIEALTAAWTVAQQAYADAETKAEAASDARQVRAGSLADLIDRYQASPGWAEKKPETRRDYQKALTPLRADFGGLAAAGLQRRHVLTIRDRYAWRTEIDKTTKVETRVPNARQANRIVTVLSILMTYAVDLGWRPDNPALRPKRLKAKGDDFRAWTEAEFLQFQKKASADWQFAALFALLTAQRGQDLVTARWSDYDGTAIYFEQEKTGAKVRIPVHQALRPKLNARRAAAKKRSPAPLTILARDDGTPWPVNAFQKAAGKAIRAAGLTGVVWHGLRSTAASWAAEGGATTEQMRHMLGHTTDRMSQHYARGASQQRLAGDAVAAIVVPIGGKKGK